ncbi:Dienelactone hydrolase [Fusarium mundagurra]|uniref:Dienelactone hydrolase n=1 Tax=Fusarium mundagurra TaxID=1567541 RepID=A0A8H5YBU3_9HYPO|nr:Dienelactone hydrolase [Fusarium mundagurra]
MSCSECFKGHSHDGQPTGEIQEMFGRPTYVTSPLDDKPVKGIIVIVPDAFGWEFVNNRLLADQYALNGDFLVYLPDFMDLELDMEAVWYFAQTIYGIAPFFYHNGLAASWPRIRSFFEALRLHESPEQRIGAAGFCWGGKPVLTLAYPESITEDGMPLVDAVFTGHPSGMSLPGDAEIVVYPRAGQGFCVQVDEKNDNLLQQSKEAEKQALNWFATHFG